jgi:hypothetical protein
MCADRAILALRYRADLRVYAEAEQTLEAAIGTKFSEALQRANRARLVFERAREQLSSHIRVHRCVESTESIHALLPRNV